MSAECKGTPTSPFRGCSGAREPIGYVSAYGADARPAADEPSESAIARESLQSRAEEGASKIWQPGAVSRATIMNKGG